MTYTIKIDQTSKQGQSIIKMLIALSIDNDFLQIYENTDTNLTSEQEKELDMTFENNKKIQ